MPFHPGVYQVKVDEGKLTNRGRLNGVRFRHVVSICIRKANELITHFQWVIDGIELPPGL